MAQVTSAASANRGAYERAGLFTLLLLIITASADGFSGKPSELTHQLVFVPLTLVFIAAVVRLVGELQKGRSHLCWWTPRAGILLAALLQALSGLVYLYEGRHFAAMGYKLNPLFGLCLIVGGLVSFASAVWLDRPLAIFLAACGCYVAAMVSAIISYPLNYLRSDMLPVILWANTNLLHHISPYQTMYVGSRVYDFPYLPGMLLFYLPAVAIHVDLRFLTTISVVLSAVLIFAAAERKYRMEVAVLVGTFLTCPYLQYRHELYNQPHWLSLVVIFVFMQRRRFLLAAFVFGLSMATYQFSWIIFPLFLLNALRRRGWVEVLKMGLAAAAAALLIVGPFIRSAYARMSSNTVGQWGLRAHADAEPINLSYWLTFFIKPGHLLRVQAALLLVVFGYCFFQGRCNSLADTLRWMLIALTTFILLNVLVDGYFYLMLLVPLLIYTCVANGWWHEYSDVPAIAA